MVLYHGSDKLFDRFDISCALTGNRKGKFGYGIYLSSSFRSAAHYSYRVDKAQRYVYEVEIPELNDDNSIDFKLKVSDSIIGRAKDRLCRDIPDKAKSNGKCLAKFSNIPPMILRCKADANSMQIRWKFDGKSIRERRKSIVRSVFILSY